MKRYLAAPIFQALVLVVSGALCGNAIGQSVTTETPWPRVNVYRFLDLANEPPNGRGFTLYERTAIEMTVRDDAARQLNGRKITIRIFRGTKEGLINAPSWRSPDCFIYWSEVRSYQFEASNFKMVPLVANPYWLNTSANKVSDEDWVLVLEDGESKDNYVRIKRDSVSDYFTKGYQLRFTADPNILAQYQDAVLRWYREGLATTPRAEYKCTDGPVRSASNDANDKKIFGSDAFALASCDRSPRRDEPKDAATVE